MTPLKRWPKRAALTSLALSAVVVLSGCGTAPWLGSGGTPTPTATPKPTATVETIINELASGSAKHDLIAGDIALSVNYWSTLSMDQWTANASKPVSFSLGASLGTDDGQKIFLSRVSLVTAVNGPTGPLPSPPEVNDQSTITPGYLVKSPYTYSQTFVLPAVDPAATSVTLSFTYELLLQTTPTSGEYSKQTAADSLTIAITK